MRFACGQCGKRFSTAHDPTPGRLYRVRCTCGNTIVVQAEARAQAAPPPLPTAWRHQTPEQPLPLQTATDDPFLRAAMHVPPQEPVEPVATASAAPSRLARRDPDYAKRDEEPEPSSPYGYQAALPETTRTRPLAATRALLLDASVRLRDILASRARQFLRSRRLVAGGAVFGIIAFAFGVWVGATSAGSRWKAKAVAAAAEARAQAGTAGTSQESVASPAPVAAPALAPAAIPSAALAPAAIAAPGVAPSRAGSEPRRPARRRGALAAEPAAARPAALEEPAATAELRTTDEPARESTRPADRMPRTRHMATSQPPEPHDVEAASEQTAAASPEPPGAGTDPGPPAEPTEAAR